MYLLVHYPDILYVHFRLLHTPIWWLSPQTNILSNLWIFLATNISLADLITYLFRLLKDEFSVISLSAFPNRSFYIVIIVFLRHSCQVLRHSCQALRHSCHIKHITTDFFWRNMRCIITFRHVSVCSLNSSRSINVFALFSKTSTVWSFQFNCVAYFIFYIHHW